MTEGTCAACRITDEVESPRKPLDDHVGERSTDHASAAQKWQVGLARIRISSSIKTIHT